MLVAAFYLLKSEWEKIEFPRGKIAKGNHCGIHCILAYLLRSSQSKKIRLSDYSNVVVMDVIYYWYLYLKKTKVK